MARAACSAKAEQPQVVDNQEPVDNREPVERMVLGARPARGARWEAVEPPNRERVE